MRRFPPIITGSRGPFSTDNNGQPLPSRRKAKARGGRATCVGQLANAAVAAAVAAAAAALVSKAPGLTLVRDGRASGS